MMIAEAAIILLFVEYLYHKRADLGGKNVLTVVLVLLALLSIVAYFDFGVYPKFGRFQNPHDFFHYYLGSKYSPEVGYYDLYECVVVADAEMHAGRPSQTSVRSMEDYRFESARDVMRRADKYRGLFSDARWAGFKDDLRYFRSILGPRRIRSVVRDKGYNATPVWNMVARQFTCRVPALSEGGMLFLVALDLILLGLMFLFIGWAFGLHAMLFSIIFFGSMFMMSQTHIRGALLRLDWVALLVMSVCMLKLGRYKTAGAMMGYAGMARIFPFVFVFGLGVKFLIDFAGTRRFNKSYLSFFTVFAITVAALLGLSIIHDGGIDHWQSFFKKIALHDGDLSPMRVGFRYIFLWMPDNPYNGWMPLERAKLEQFEGLQWLWWSIQAVVLIAAGFLLRKLEDYETVAFCYVPAFFLTAPTFYYQVMVMIALFLFLPKRERLLRTSGVSLMFAVSIAAFVFRALWGLDLKFSFSLSWMLLALCAYMALTGLIAVFQSGKDSAPGAVGADEPGGAH